MTKRPGATSDNGFIFKKKLKEKEKEKREKRKKQARKGFRPPSAM